MSPRTSLTSKVLATGVKNNEGDTVMDEYDGRTRNAKAQKRHREKQKARVKAVSDRPYCLIIVNAVFSSFTAGGVCSGTYCPTGGCSKATWTAAFCRNFALFFIGPFIRVEPTTSGESVFA